MGTDFNPIDILFYAADSFTLQPLGTYKKFAEKLEASGDPDRAFEYGKALGDALIGIALAPTVGSVGGRMLHKAIRRLVPQAPVERIFEKASPAVRKAVKNMIMGAYTAKLCREFLQPLGFAMLVSPLGAPAFALGLGMSTVVDFPGAVCEPAHEFGREMIRNFSQELMENIGQELINNAANVITGARDMVTPQEERSTEILEEVVKFGLGPVGLLF